MGPSVELVTQLIFPFKTNFCNLIKFSISKNYSKFNISHISNLKISKSPSLNRTHHEVSNNTKNVPKFDYKFLVLIKIKFQ
jgi:hypothetical protein